jgi:hypothetical protein
MKFPYIQECQFRFRAFLICLKIKPGAAADEVIE